MCKSYIEVDFELVRCESKEDSDCEDKPHHAFIEVRDEDGRPMEAIISW
jgi:hypothetical protein